MSDLIGKCVVVTGASSGIGEGAAILFARRGCSVSLTGRDLGRLQDAVQKCKAAAVEAGHKDSKFLAVDGDITDVGTREKLLAQTVEAFGQVDVLVVNHGIVAKEDSFETLTEEDFDTTISINLKSALFLIKAATPHLEKTKGSAVCVSSLSSRVASHGKILTYSIAKAGMDHMVRCLTMDLGPKGIRINTINPTYVNTRIFREVGIPDINDAAHLIFRQATPLRERFEASSSDEQAEVIAFLASDAARFISGESIAVDGGVLCRGNPFNFPPCEDT